MYNAIFILIVALSCLSFTCSRSISNKNQEFFVANPSPTPASGEDTRPKWLLHYWEATRLRTLGKYMEAIEEFKKAAELRDDKEIYREISNLYYGLKRYEEAEVYIRKVLEKDPKDDGAHWSLAVLWVRHLGRYEEGLKEALISKEMNRDKSLSYVYDHLIGQAYDGLGDYENAIKHYRIFLKGSSFAPDAADYKEVKKRVSELEGIVK